MRTVALLRRALSAGQDVTGGPWADDVVLVDLLRRSEQLKDATRQIEVGLSRNPPEIFQRILEFERDLVATGDVRCHKVTEVHSKSKSKES